MVPGWNWYSAASRSRRLGRHEEAGVVHAERLEDLAAQVLVEAVSRQYLDQATDDVGGQPVVPPRARVEFQRVLGQQGRDALESQPLGPGLARLGEGVVDRVARKEPPGKARHVHEDVFDVHGPGGFDGDDRAVGLRLADPEIAPLGDVAVDGVGELEHPPLIELHEGNRCDGLGHGVDAKDGVVLGRARPLPVHQPERPLIGQASAPHDGDLAPRESSRAARISLRSGRSCAPAGLRSSPLHRARPSHAPRSWTG